MVDIADKPGAYQSEGGVMEYAISPISSADRTAIMDIFNYYVENSFAAYPETRLPEEAFEMLRQMSKGLPTSVVRNQKGEVVGFGMLRTHNPFSTFSWTAEATYFIHPDWTGKGLGKSVLAVLEKGARERGITNILASISSLNPRSIAFHKKNGFVECGRFLQVGKKMGREFDTVWMQKQL